MKEYKGLSENIYNDIVGKITKKPVSFFKRGKYIILTENLFDLKNSYRGTILVNRKNSKKSVPKIVDFSKKNANELNDNDIVLLNREGVVTRLWDANSKHNCILITEECNCKCIMCPQPPKKDNPETHKINREILDLLDPFSVKEICLSGGEPLLKSNILIEYLSKIKAKFPNATIALLTNGAHLSDFYLLKKLCDIQLKNLQFCISLHADWQELHDKITNLKGSFNNTTLGILNLAKFRQFIEIRYVISKLNYKRLVNFSHFIYKNFPFVMHVAFMAIEVAGHAETNFDKIWIDPLEYSDLLKEAVHELRRRKMHVSIYNIPLCLIDQSLWKFARQSISDWKNFYMDECENCSVKSNCCGFFSTSAYHSDRVNPKISA